VGTHVLHSTESQAITFVTLKGEGTDVFLLTWLKLIYGHVERTIFLERYISYSVVKGLNQYHWITMN